MTASVTRFFERLAFIALAVSLLAGLASCGSGAVSGSPSVVDPTRITVLPGTGSTLYSGQPTTFVFSGGTGSYIASSSNQAVIPVAGVVSGNTLTVVPNPVLVDTQVTITVRDTGNTPIETAVVTVKPGTINNDITITPSSTQGDICPVGTLCSGGDAVVSVTLSLGGVALPGRTVRFDAISGDYRFITSPTGTSPEILATSVLAVTDEAGRATARIRVTAVAPNQTALLQVTDLSSGAFRTVTFTIAQATGASPGFFVTPTSVTFTGPRADRCATSTANDSISAEFFIFGGTAPYTISSSSSAFSVNRETVSFSGGSFRISPNGQCVENAPIIIRDAAGRTVTVTASNVRGTDAVPPLAVGPQTVTLSSCSSIATVTPTGGTGNYFASSGSGAIIVGSNGQGGFQIQRNPNSPASPTPVNVAISDGVSTVNVVVNLTGAGAGQCPTPAFAASSTDVFLDSCGGSVQVLLSGGSGTYTAVSNSPSITSSVSGSVLTIRRTPNTPGPGGNPPQSSVVASDGQSPTIRINVSTGNNAMGVCPP